MRTFAVLAAMLLLFLAPRGSWARGGGGCLAEGTPVLTPSGPVAIEKLRVGEAVWSVQGGKLHEARVQAVTRVRPREFLQVTAGEEALRVTAEHLVMVAPGQYRTADRLEIGDTVYLAWGAGLGEAVIRSIRRIPAESQAYNLLVSPGGTYAAAGMVVHNKGCFLPESRILKADGAESPISAVRPGDELLAFTAEGRLVRARTREVIRSEVDEYVILRTDRETLRVTTEHPFFVGNGTFKTLDILGPGDAIFAWDGQSLSQQRIVSLEKVRERVAVFNLQTDRPNTFFAGSIAVHNKGGGCFPMGTQIATPRGSSAIEDLAAGEPLLGVNEEGAPVRATVRGLFLAKNRLVAIHTDNGLLTATPEHPIGLWTGGFQEAGQLGPGDRVRRWEEGRAVMDTIREVTPGAQEELVFNLQVSEPNTFVAEGVVVHNKGGSSSRSSSSRSGSGSRSGGSSEEMTTLEWILLIGFFMVWCGIFFGILFFVRSKKGKSENLDFVYSPKDVARKAEKTDKLLAFLSQQDPSVAPEALRKLAESVFRKLQECWQAREYSPMEPLMMTALFAQHTAQLQGMARNHEINRIENLKVERVDLVNVRYTEKPDHREFTALVSASARDYYVDDRNNKFLRGDNAAAKFQEFWTFQRSASHWLLREVEQAGESDILKDENFAEMLTEETVQRIYGEVAKEGEAGPWLEKGEETKADRIERLLNFLVQTDKLWDRRQMLERARQLFMGVYLARESGDFARVPADGLFPDVAKSLRDQIRDWQKDGLSMEYRNLCVRKAELILVRNFAEQAKDEFTVRMDAHAQKVSRKGERVLSQQEYVTPFEEYWTFGRMEGKWRLKEVLPPARGKKMIAVENVDEDSSAGQLDWYYRQTRAN